MNEAPCYLSVCSGIEAASVAWEPLGFKPAGFAEIEPFPSAVLAHHWPHVPNYGDLNQLPAMVANGDAPAADILVGGTPCQAFSVAGLRAGLSDARGALTLAFVRLANAIDDVRTAGNIPECVIVWENVPGVLSSKDNAFGHFLAGLAGEDSELQPPGEKWAYAGVVLGPQRSIAWRTLDAQYFGLAQRRRRVFVVASARNGFDPCEVLFEFEGVRRDSPPSREKGEGVAGPLYARAGNGGFPGTDGAASGHVVATLDASYYRLQGCSGQDSRHGHSHLVPVAFGQNRQSGPVELSHALSGHAVPHGRLDFETETFLVQSVTGDIVHTLNTANNGKHSSEDGTGRGVPVIAFSSKDHGADAIENLSPTLRAMGHANSHANAGGQVAVAFHENQRAEVTLNETAGALNSGGGKPGQGYPAVTDGMAVRRLMPGECEKLQGFQPGHTLIPIKKGFAKDGPRYKSIGNSMAVTCMRWIGRRIQFELSRGCIA